MYYNYIYLDPRKIGKYEYETICLLYEPFYIGKGKGDRCYNHLQDSKRIDNPIFKNKINKIKSLGYNLRDFIVILNHTNNEEESYEKEIKLIREIGSELIVDIKNGPLSNVCLINQPPSLKGKTYKEIYGDRWKDEIEKRRELQIAKGGYFKDRKHKTESKEKISISISGDKNPMWGKKHSAETIALQKQSKIGMFDGKDNPNKKSFKFISPNNEIYIVVGEFKKFCTEHNLSISTLSKTLRTKKRVKHGRTKGWIVEYFDI